MSSYWVLLNVDDSSWQPLELPVQFTSDFVKHLIIHIIISFALLLPAYLCGSQFPATLKPSLNWQIQDFTSTDVLGFRTGAGTVRG